MLTRRGILGSFAGLLAYPKTLFDQRAAGFPAARFTSTLLSKYQYNECLELNRIVQSKPPQSIVFRKKDLEPYDNSEDTSIVFCEFGVNIYTDPSGIYIKEGEHA